MLYVHILPWYQDSHYQQRKFFFLFDKWFWPLHLLEASNIQYRKGAKREGWIIQTSGERKQSLKGMEKDRKYQIGR